MENSLNSAEMGIFLLSCGWASPSLMRFRLANFLLNSSSAAMFKDRRGVGIVNCLNEHLFSSDAQSEFIILLVNLTQRSSF